MLESFKKFNITVRHPNLQFNILLNNFEIPYERTELFSTLNSLAEKRYSMVFFMNETRPP